MTSWSTVELGEICDLVGGGTPKKSRPEFYGGGILWATVRDLHTDCIVTTEHTVTPAGLASSSAKVVPAGTVVIAARVGLGKVAVLGEDAALNQDLRGLVVREQGRVLPRYLYWWYRSVASRVVAAGTGATVQGVTLPFLKSLPVPLPPVSEQQRISDALDRVTTSIAQYSKTLAAIQARQSALRRAYTDAALKALDARSVALAELCDVFTDGDWIESKDQSPSGIRLIQTGNIGSGVFRDRLEKARWISPATFDRLRCTELLPGDVVFSRLPEPVGRACLVPDNGTKMITAVDCTIARPDEAVLLPRFLLLYASSSAYFREVQSMVTGTTRDRISRKNLGRVRIPIPSITTQQELLSAADRAETGFAALESAVVGGLRNAEVLASSALEAAFRGEL